MDLLKALFTFVLIIALLHRSVISTAVVAAGVVLLLSAIGKLADSRLRVGKTVSTLAVLLLLVTPFLGALSPKRVDAFMETIGGIFAPSEDETGSWRIEQSNYYMSQFVDRPLLGWRYEGYDRGEVMVHEDFAEKGTVIHSHFVDMLYNYGVVGLAINLFLILSTLFFIYLRNRTFSSEQAILFAFITSGLLFGVSYQLPVFYWSFVGVGMFYGKNQKLIQPVSSDPDILLANTESSRDVALSTTNIRL
jgi:O-antigen ligase